MKLVYKRSKGHIYLLVKNPMAAIPNLYSGAGSEVPQFGASSSSLNIPGFSRRIAQISETWPGTLAFRPSLNNLKEDQEHCILETDRLFPILLLYPICLFDVSCSQNAIPSPYKAILRQKQDNTLHLYSPHHFTGQKESISQFTWMLEIWLFSGQRFSSIKLILVPFYQAKPLLCISATSNRYRHVTTYNFPIQLQFIQTRSLIYSLKSIKLHQLSRLLLLLHVAVPTPKRNRFLKRLYALA